MNNVAKSAIMKGRELTFAVDSRFEGYSLPYPIKAVNRCHYEAKLIRNDNYPSLKINVDGELVVYDTRTGIPFAYQVSFVEKADILDEEDGEGSGYIIPGNSIDLDELCLMMIVSSLPLRLVKDENEPLSIGIDGITFATDD